MRTANGTRNKTLNPRSDPSGRVQYCRVRPAPCGIDPWVTKRRSTAHPTGTREERKRRHRDPTVAPAGPPRDSAEDSLRFEHLTNIRPSRGPRQPTIPKTEPGRYGAPRTTPPISSMIVFGRPRKSPANAGLFRGLPKRIYLRAEGPFSSMPLDMKVRKYSRLRYSSP